MTIFRAGIFCVTILLSALGISSCGEGGSSNAGPSESSQLVAGGTIAEPAIMSFEEANEIQSDPFENYFKVSVSAGDTIFIKVTLQSELGGLETSRCSSMGQFPIDLIGESRWCGLNVKHTFGSAGEYKIHFNYEDGNIGYFNAAIIPAGAVLTPSIGASGRPEDPRLILLGGADNFLSENDLFNHFVYDAQAGDTLHIQTYPDNPPSSTERSICYGHYGRYDDSTSYGVYISETDRYLSETDRYSCDGAFAYLFDRAGRYYLNVRFINGAKGYFRAVVTTSK